MDYITYFLPVSRSDARVTKSGDDREVCLMRMRTQSITTCVYDTIPLGEQKVSVAILAWIYKDVCYCFLHTCMYTYAKSSDHIVGTFYDLVLGQLQ